MEQKELDQELAALWKELRGLGVPVSKKLDPHVRINTRAKRRLGCCVYSPGQCAVEVSARILEDPELLRLTLVHELLHTCPGCRNHGPQWKSWARIAGQALGLDVQRTVPLEDSPGPLRQESVKYVLQCQSCGALIPRKRMSKAVKAPWRYRCSCGGRLKRLPDAALTFPDK